MPDGKGQPFLSSFNDHANAQAQLTHITQLRELSQKIDSEVDKFYTQSLEMDKVDEEDGPGGDMDYLGLKYNNNNQSDDDAIASEENPFSE